MQSRVRMSFGPALKLIICSSKLLRRDSYWSGGISVLKERKQHFFFIDFAFNVRLTVEYFTFVVAVVKLSTRKFYTEAYYIKSAAS